MTDDDTVPVVYDLIRVNINGRGSYAIVADVMPVENGYRLSVIADPTDEGVR